MNDENRIKTALELAMEKTTGMRASGEEMKSLKEKELRGKIKGVVVKYLNERKRIKDLLAGLEEVGGSDQGMARSFMVEELLSSIELEGDNAAVMEGLVALAGKAVAADLENLKRILQNFDKQRSEAEREHTAIAVEKLKKSKIGGSALVPNLRGDEQWQSTCKNIETGYSEDLDKVKKALFSTALHSEQ